MKISTLLRLLPDDLNESWKIEQPCHAFPFGAKIFTNNQSDQYLNYKLCVNEHIAAFAIVHTVLDEASLFNITVHPEFRRQGNGRALLQHLIDELEQREVLTLWLEVRKSNFPAIALYHSLGFNAVSVRHDYYPTKEGREDALIMVLPFG